MDRTAPNGRVIGIDIIPAQPPRGVSTVQGNFLSIAVQQEVKNLLRDAQIHALNCSSSSVAHNPLSTLQTREIELGMVDSVELESRMSLTENGFTPPTKSMDADGSGRNHSRKVDGDGERLVDVVLSDMSAPWEQIAGFWKKSLSDPYFRMMNTSGMSFRDHASSMVSSSAGRFDFQIHFHVLDLMVPLVVGSMCCGSTFWV